MAEIWKQNNGSFAQLNSTNDESFYMCSLLLCLIPILHVHPCMPFSTVYFYDIVGYSCMPKIVATILRGISSAVPNPIMNVRFPTTMITGNDRRRWFWRECNRSFSMMRPNIFIGKNDPFIFHVQNPYLQRRTEPVLRCRARLVDDKIILERVSRVFVSRSR